MKDHLLRSVGDTRIKGEKTDFGSNIKGLLAEIVFKIFFERKSLFLATFRKLPAERAR